MKSATHLYLTTALACSSLLAVAQDQQPFNRQHLAIGPILGYNYGINGLNYGLGALYEFRPEKQLSFFAGLNYLQTRRSSSHQNTKSFTGEIWKQHLTALNFGARYYANEFYFAGAIGLAYKNELLLGADGRKTPLDSGFGFYKSLSTGYTLPISTHSIGEFEAGVYGIKESMNVGGTMRYKFGW